MYDSDINIKLAGIELLFAIGQFLSPEE